MLERSEQAGSGGAAPAQPQNGDEGTDSDPLPAAEPPPAAEPADVIPKIVTS